MRLQAQQAHLLAGRATDSSASQAVHSLLAWCAWLRLRAAWHSRRQHCVPCPSSLGRIHESSAPRRMEPTERTPRSRPAPRMSDPGSLPVHSGGMSAPPSLFVTPPPATPAWNQRAPIALAPQLDSLIAAKVQRLSCPVSCGALSTVAETFALGPASGASQSQPPCGGEQRPRVPAQSALERLSGQASLKRHCSDSGVFRPLSDSAISRKDIEALLCGSPPGAGNEGAQARRPASLRRHTDSATADRPPLPRPVYKKGPQRLLVPGAGRTERAELAALAPLQPATMMRSCLEGPLQHPEAGLRDVDEVLNCGVASHAHCAHGASYVHGSTASRTPCTPTQRGFGTVSDAQTRGDDARASLVTDHQGVAVHHEPQSGAMSSIACNPLRVCSACSNRSLCALSESLQFVAQAGKIANAPIRQHSVIAKLWLLVLSPDPC